jgi:hypothetical protein
MIDFSGQVVIVTGVGRGLGRWYAMELARRGASVVVNDIGGTMHGEGSDPGVADRVVEEIERAGGLAVASHDSVASPEGGEAGDEVAGLRPVRLHCVLGGSVRATRGCALCRRQGGPRRAGERHRDRRCTARDPRQHRAPIRLFAHGHRDGRRPGTASRRVVVPACHRSRTGRARRRLPRSAACELTHQNYSACAGRFARVFVGLGDGWLAEPGSKPTADDVASHIDEISATEPFTVPSSIIDEVAGICDRLGIA